MEEDQEEAVWLICRGFWRWSVNFADSMDAVSVRKERRERKGRSCPFETNKVSNSEIQQIFWAGKMQMLFGLVAAKIINLELASDIAGMSLLEAEEMLQGFWEAEEMGGDRV